MAKRPKLVRLENFKDSSHRLIRAGRFKEAIAELLTIHHLDSSDFDTLINLSFLYNQTAQYEQALSFAMLAIKNQPQTADSWTNCGIALQNLGRNSDAIDALKHAVTLAPNNPLTLFNLGRLQIENYDIELGLRNLENAKRLAPDIYEIHLQIGSGHLKSCNYANAILSLSKALALNPSRWEARSLLAEAYFESRQFSNALVAIDEALSLNAPKAPSLRLKAKIHRSTGMPHIAKRFANEALALEPQSADSLCVLGIIHHDLLEAEDALDCFDKALALKVDYPTARWNKALTLLREGRLQEGWDYYEARKLLGITNKNAACHSLSDWDGSFSIEDKHLFIYCEQGLGDVIQFSRFVFDLLSLAKFITFQVPASLLSLFNREVANLRVIDETSAPDGAEFSCSLLSLPRILNVRANTIPHSNHLLVNNTLKSDVFLKRLGGKTKPRIGLCWSGGAGSAHQIHRGISLEELQGCLRIDAEFYCLQKDVSETDRPLMAQDARIHDSSAMLTDFGDTAALISHMDLVISIDTSVAHLSASLGVTTWVLLIFSPDFRWFLRTTDSPWYPSAKLFRQTRPGDWNNVVSEVGEALEGRYPYRAHPQASSKLS